MDIQFIRGIWGMERATLEDNLRMIKEGGFDGVEMGVPQDHAGREELRGLLDQLGLTLVAQQWTQGQSAEEHVRSFEEQYRRSAELSPLFVNSHTGKDHFALEENLPIFKRAEELERELGVVVAHEIHRGRATFSTTSTMALIDALPGVRFTADLSHWCCVHESFLEDQAARVERAIEHTHHIHARVGHREGPQVTDPRAPEWHDAVEIHLDWWQKIVDHHARIGTKMLTICPEFGPPDYMVTLPYTRQPVANLWDINCYMMDLLKRRLDFH